MNIVDLLVLFHQIPNFSHHPNTVKCPKFKNPTSFYFLSHTLKTKQILSKTKERGFAPFDLNSTRNLMIQIAEFLLNIVNVKIGLVLIRINWFWFWFLMGDSVWYGFPVTDMSAMVNWFKLSIGFWWETEEFVKERERERERESESESVAETFGFCCSRTRVI